MRANLSDSLRSQAKKEYGVLKEAISNNATLLASLLASSQGMGEASVKASKAAKKSLASEAKLRVDAAELHRAADVIMEAADAAKEAAEALLASSNAARTNSAFLKQAFTAAEQDQYARALAIEALLDAATNAEKSTDEEGPILPTSPPRLPNVVAQQFRGFDGSISDDWETASQQSILNTSYGRGSEATGPVSTAMLGIRGSTDSTAAITPSGALIGVGLAGSQHIVSTTVGIGDGRTGVDTTEKEEKNELTGHMSSQDMDMSITESTDQSQQSSQQSLYPPTSSPPPSPG
jgi:hypothetical protein